MPDSQKISPNFHKELLPSFLRAFNVSLAMSSDPKNYFCFLVDEISEPGLTINWIYFLTLKRALKAIRRKQNSKYSLNEFRLKASFKHIESI